MSQQQTEGGDSSSIISSSNNLTDHPTNLSQQNSSSTNGSDNMMIDTDSLITSSEKQLVKRLRQYETTAYSSVVSAFRAQGEITWEKLKVLTQLQQMLHISTSRHSTELLRSEVDVKIQQVAQSGVYNTIEREIEDKNNQFDFSLASETDSENDNYVHHRVKHAVPSSSVEHIAQQSTVTGKESKRGSSGRGRGRGKKRSSSTMVADSVAHSPSKPISAPSDPVVVETPPNTPSKAVTTTSTAASSSQSQNGTPAKKKRGRKSKKQTEAAVTTSQPTPSVAEIVQPPVQPVAAIVEPVQQISEEIRRHLAATTFLTDDDINRASMEEIESIADRESNEIEELEQKLDGLSPNDTNAIVQAITKKKETLEKLIQKLETAEE